MIASSTLRTFARRGLTALAVACLPLITGGWLTGPQSTFDTKGPVAKAQLDVFYVTLWVTGIIFVLVAGILTYATLKFKARNDADEHAPVPPQGHGNPLIELGLIALSVIALVFIAIPTLHHIWYTYDVPEEEKATAYEVNAIGYQWWFKFEYPRELVADAPLTLANELVIPAGRAVRVNLRTFDVIHSFWVPKLAGKVDMMPNRANHLWLKADEPGYFWGQCAEYCGESHAVMRFRVIALNEADFAAWVAHQKLPGKPVTTENAKIQFASYKPLENKRNAPGWSEKFDADPFKAWTAQQLPEVGSAELELVNKGKAIFTAKTCNSCHAVRGDQPAAGNPIVPDLTHVGSRTTIAGGLLENTPENLHRWLTDPNGVKPGNKMYRGFTGGMNGYAKVDHDTNTVTGHNITVNDDEARALVAYLHSLK
ncbi:cytochrome c oxidase subunit II [Nibricoccus aquaticus]|uniref:cytochrome-c oxidase n=1 Tax=Nibricoccus aquaticus TaxID=2576891 RepID=A0A290Q9J9_9BACT|nr:cytochrome c oxidase subunit II [Nibricoccus aquaticus]ATC64937.1 cytochrome c oxidase subunit II [Nibricoccus aquaticus]